MNTLSEHEKKRSSAGVGASVAVADAAASAEALCRALDSAKLSGMAADLRAAGPTRGATAASPSDGGNRAPVTPKKGSKQDPDDDSTHSSALLQEQAEEERRLTSLSPEMADFDLSRLRGTKAPDGERGHRRERGGRGPRDDEMGHDRDAGHGGGGHGVHNLSGGGGLNASGNKHGSGHAASPDEGDADLTNLAEIVPGLMSRAGTLEEAATVPLPRHVEEGADFDLEGDNALHGEDGKLALTGESYNRYGGSAGKPPQKSLEFSAHRTNNARWSTEVNTGVAPHRNKKSAGKGNPHDIRRSPGVSEMVNNIDSMNVGKSDDEDVSGAAGTGADASPGSAAKKQDGCDSDESLVTRDDAEAMPEDDSAAEYAAIAGLDDHNNNQDSSSSSDSGNRSGDNTSGRDNTSDCPGQGGARSSGRGSGGDTGRRNCGKGGGGSEKPSLKSPEYSDDGGHNYHNFDESTDLHLPTAPEPDLHEYGDVSGGNSASAANVGRPVPHSFQSIASLSTQTATQTHEVRMPMYLPTFKPATGCTNASDFIVRCFVARLRSGITVVKHGRSRWCKSRLRILHVHSDGRSLTWKPALGEPSSSKRPPKLDLSTCQEVRHAWSPDPLNPMFTGTPILRQKCEAANAHKSFALIFPKRTVDITAVTADQCKVLMEGFSALCFRLQVANLAGRGAAGGAAGTAGTDGKKGGRGGGKSEQSEEDRATTASVTLTNTSRADLSPTTRVKGLNGGGALRAVRNVR